MANLENRDVLVVGGGTVATRKILPLLDTGARIHVTSPDFSPKIQSLISGKKVLGAKRAFAAEDIVGMTLVFAATDNKRLNREIATCATQAGIPVNNATGPEDCTFLVPSSITRGPLTLAVSTSGKSPAVSRWLRSTLEKDIGPEYGALTNWMGRLRQDLLNQGFSTDEIRDISRHLLTHDILTALKNGNPVETTMRLTNAFEAVLASPAPESVLSLFGLSGE